MRGWRQSIPNALSLSRIPLGLGFLVVYDAGAAWRFCTALGIALLALATDVADGRLARHWGAATDAGALIDGLGDKAFYVAVYLVIAAEDPSQTLLIWGLIIREVALYALRTVDGDRMRHTKQLRWASLAYAGVIRTYFLQFFIMDLYSVLGRPAPGALQYGYILGYVALVFGIIGLSRLARDISEAP